MPNGHLIHVLFDRDLSQRAPVVALVATDPPFLYPFFLDVRLAALRAHEHSLLKQHTTLFFHMSLG